VAPASATTLCRRHTARMDSEIASKRARTDDTGSTEMSKDTEKRTARRLLRQRLEAIVNEDEIAEAAEQQEADRSKAATARRAEYDKKRYDASKQNKLSRSESDILQDTSKLKRCQVESSEAKAKRAAYDRKRNEGRHAQSTAFDHVQGHICRHCGQEGHLNPIARTSCPLYCTYCLAFGHSQQQCPTQLADSINNQASNADAKSYKVSSFFASCKRQKLELENVLLQEAIDGTMMFHSCGICDREYGLRSMLDITSAADRIANSAIPVKFAAMLAPLNDPAASKGERAYAAAAQTELDNGVRNGAQYVCNECYKQLPQDASILASTIVPKLALVNGYFRGACPPELEGLSIVDLSLISLINVITHLAMLPRGVHYRSSATVFSVVNNVSEIAAVVPRTDDVRQFCMIIKPDGAVSPKTLQYNPYRVRTALEWLDLHNDLYNGVVQIPKHWRKSGAADDLEVPHISANDEDYEGIGGDGKEAPAGDDGHPVNPGAPDSDTANVLLHSPDPQDTRQLLSAIACPRAAPSVVMIRQNGEYVADYSTGHFMQKAFPHLYPYGRGGPGDSPDVTFDHAYIANMLLLGNCRSFQRCPRFVFYSYTWLMRKKVGTIAHLAERTGRSGVEEFTVADAKQLLVDLTAAGDPHAGCALSKAKLWSMISKLQPYSQFVPGTELYFAEERRKLMAVISSPATTVVGQWTWFYTEAQADMYLAEIYDNAVTSFPGTRLATRNAALPERLAVSDSLTAKQREDILQSHPFMSARIHALQQDAFWKHVLQGKRRPLGDITDYWMRVEFQMKGTPHLHSLISISKASMPGITEHSVHSDDPTERRRVEDLVERVSTARLLKRLPEDDSELPDDDTYAYRKVQEQEWNYNIHRPTYFNDATAPGRERFASDGLDYSVNTATGVFTDPRIQILYRRLQLANQMHKCRNSCYKYCRKNLPQLCRYGFTKEPLPGNDTRAVVVTDKDRRSRKRTRVLPPRNNGNINNHFMNPVCFIAGKGNQDIQYIQNTTGGAEYCSKYCSKAEAVESTALQNAVNRKLATYVSRLNDHDRISAQWQLRAVGNAIIGAQQVGTVQACYVLGKLPVVKSSRATEFVNCLPRSALTSRRVILAEDELNALNGGDSALSCSPTTQHGKRDAYHSLWKQQMAEYGVVNINYFSFLSSFTLVAVTQRCPASKVREGCKLLILDINGFILKPVTFKLGKVGASAVEHCAEITNGCAYRSNTSHDVNRQFFVSAPRFPLMKVVKCLPTRFFCYIPIGDPKARCL
jgi:hypothetical protein